MMKAIVAADINNGIGYNNKLPWYCKEDLNFFKLMTLHETVIMGSSTFKSLMKPLSDRTNIIVSSSISMDDLYKYTNCYVINYSDIKNYSYGIVIGGAKLLESMINDNLITQIFLSRINDEFTCDTFINLDKFKLSFSTRFSEIFSVEKWVLK